MDAVEFRSLVVEGPCQPLVIGRARDAAEAEEGSALGLAVAVEQHAVAAGKIAGEPLVVGMLGAGNVAQIIGIGTIGRGYG